MLSYCLKWRKNTESKKPKVEKVKNKKIMLSSVCAICGSKKLRFIEDQEARGLLSKLTGIKVLILSDLPKWMQ